MFQRELLELSSVIQIQGSANEVQLTHGDAGGKCTLTAEAMYRVQNEKTALQSANTTLLQNEKTTLQNSITTLQNEKTTLQSANNALGNVYDTLQSANNALQDEKTTLQTEKNHIETQPKKETEKLGSIGQVFGLGCRDLRDQLES